MNIKTYFSGLLIMISTSLVTDAMAYQPYFSIGGGYYDTHVKFKWGSASVSSNGLSLSATAGMRFNEYVSVEVNALVNQLLVEGYDTRNDVTFVGVMPGVRVGKKILGIFYPYVGASAGPSWVMNNRVYNGAESSTTNTTFAYQARAGIMFSIGGMAGLDFGVRYQSQGRLNLDAWDYAMDSNVTSFNYYITASYGF